jgi:hypothetical protein
LLDHADSPDCHNGENAHGDDGSTTWMQATPESPNYELSTVDSETIQSEESARQLLPFAETAKGQELNHKEHKGHKEPEE